MKYLLAIDQGTTNSRAILFTREGKPVSQAVMSLKQYFPQAGFVEQDPQEIWENTKTCCIQALNKLRIPATSVAAIGISNQRETTLIWDRRTGQPLYPAIVWQDRRTAALCLQLATTEINQHLQEKTGLLLDSYFSATKIMWILENVPGARQRAEQGELAFGTVDTFLLWQLTQGKSHYTDATNASRTLLFNIHTQTWDQDILKAFNIPSSLLPQVLDSSAYFGETTVFGAAIPITGIAGDQQAATIGQVCFQPGMVKSTYGTGCFMLLNTGEKVVYSKNKLLSTIAYRLNGNVTYGLEGSIFCAGETIKWLRDNLKIIKTAEETDLLAQSIPDTQGVYLIPAFNGLGAPDWNPYARATILGMNRNTGVNQIVRAALEAVCYQSRDLLEAMLTDSQLSLNLLRVDGGMAVNQWLMQFLADMLAITVQRPLCTETSALGAAFLAGLQIGLYQNLAEISALWKANASFLPSMLEDQREKLYTGWKNNLALVR